MTQWRRRGTRRCRSTPSTTTRTCLRVSEKGRVRYCRFSCGDAARCAAGAWRSAAAHEPRRRPAVAAKPRRRVAVATRQTIGRLSEDELPAASRTVLSSAAGKKGEPRAPMVAMERCCCSAVTTKQFHNQLSQCADDAVNPGDGTEGAVWHGWEGCHLDIASVVD